VTPSYLSRNLAGPGRQLPPLAWKTFEKCGIFRISWPWVIPPQALSLQKSVSAVAFLPVGFGKVRHRHPIAREGLSA
jgi:hypothetical protein